MIVLRDVVEIALGAVLVLAGLLKLAYPRAGARALATYGIARPAQQWTLWAALCACELALGAATAAGLAAAAYAGAALALAFALAGAGAVRAGRSGQPCGCLGPRSRVGLGAVARDGALALALAVAPSLPAAAPGAQAWLAVGLVLALAAIAGLAVAVAALAREVGVLRLELRTTGALEIPDEGPELGSLSAVVERCDPGSRARLALAVFSSEGCRLCERLEPAVAALARDPAVALAVLDEHRDADAWRALDIPGSPYAVALSLDGTVRAKGTFNTLSQLESVLAAAQRREAEALHG